MFSLGCRGKVGVRCTLLTPKGLCAHQADNIINTVDQPHCWLCVPSDCCSILKLPSICFFFVFPL